MRRSFDISLLDVPSAPAGNASISLGAALILDFAGAPVLDPRIDFTRASAAMRVNSAGLWESVASGAARFGYSVSTIGLLIGLMIEEQRTNLFTYSQAFANAAWSTVGIVRTDNNAISPDGTTNASLFTFQTTPYASIFRTVTAANATPHVLSVFAKAGTRNTISLELRGASGSVHDYEFTLTGAGTATINGSAVGSPTGGIIALPNGWYWCWIKKTTTNTTPIAIIGAQSAVNTQTAYFYQADLQAGDCLLSPIPTVASQVTRSADSAVIDGADFAAFFNASEGTIIASGETAPGLAAATTQALLSFDDGTVNDFMIIGRASAGGGGAIMGQIFDGGVNQATMATSNPGNRTAFKAALAYKANDAAISLNGAAAVTDGSVTLPTVDRMTIGALPAGARHWNGHVKRIVFHPQRRIDDDLEVLAG